MEVGAVVAMISEVQQRPRRTPLPSRRRHLPLRQPRTGGGGRSPGRAVGCPAADVPAVRRIIEDYNLDPASIAGTGKDGRLTKEDVLAAIEKARPAHWHAVAPPRPRLRSLRPIPARKSG
ncbi:E3 binding domain-containing protein [Hankyongella ginsenosidimutans]|uniref:E3 binding domain-containing protein n=1 Tax=Hankyongella ginsenosidimutans TaxID=1763828 RepID=UPI00319E1734